jgi:Xaa-Pro dipeptidase
MEIKKVLVFSLAEYQERLQNVRQLMVKQGLDVLLVHTPENIYYLSGYQTPGYYMYQALVLPVEKPPLLITRLLEETNVFANSWIEDSRPYTDLQDPLEWTARVLKELDLANARIGLEQTCWFLTINQSSRLMALLPDATWVDSSGTIETFRGIKSPAEIEYLRKAAQIASAGMQAGLNAIQVGSTERQVAAQIYETMVNEGGDEPGMPVFVSSGPRTMLVHHTTYSDIPFSDGDVVFIEMSACYRRYSAALLRTTFIGNVEPEIITRANVSARALQVSMDFLKPGVTSGDVHAVWKKAVEDGGYRINKRAGYSMGITFSPDWGEGYLLDLKDSDPTIMAPGMTFHIPSSIRIPNRQAVGISETVLVTADGCEALTSLPRNFLYR